VRAVDAKAGELVVDFDGREVAYDFGELDALVLAYATTVHKAQGSEWHRQVKAFQIYLMQLLVGKLPADPRL
jgi:hypothetical protein